MTPEAMMMQLIDMAECAQGRISEDNDHPAMISDSWVMAINYAARLSGSTMRINNQCRIVKMEKSQ